MGKAIVIITIPMAFLTAFSHSPSAWVATENRGDVNGAGFSGAIVFPPFWNIFLYQWNSLFSRGCQFYSLLLA